MRPTLDRSKLRELGEQFKQKLGGSEDGFFDLPKSPQASASDGERKEDKDKPAQGGGGGKISG